MWFGEVTDLETGITGYDSPGSLGARTIDNENYPRDGQALTSAALLFDGLFPKVWNRSQKLEELQREIPLRNLPAWTADGLGNDMYGWVLGSWALAGDGSREERMWRKELVKAALEGQVLEGANAGSWDPIGPWGVYGGRAYSTAMMVLASRPPCATRRPTAGGRMHHPTVARPATPPPSKGPHVRRQDRRDHLRVRKELRSRH